MRSIAPSISLIFVKNDEGEVTGLILHRYGRDYPGKKII